MTSFSMISIHFISTYKYCELQLNIGPSTDTGPEVWLQLNYVVTKV